MPLFLLESSDDLLLESGYNLLLEGGVTLTVHVREKPPLRLHWDIQTPNGRHYRWGPDEPDPANVPAGSRFSSTMPGGYETGDCTLARKSNVDYSDLERLSTLRAIGPGGAIAWEGRLERTPRTSGDQLAISPSAVGWQANLEDDKSASMIYVDRDLSHWGEMSRTRRLALLAQSRMLGSIAVAPDKTNGLPGLILSWQGAWASGIKPAVQAVYDAGAGNHVDSLYYDYVLSTAVSVADTNYELLLQAMNADDFTGTVDASSDLAGSASGSGTFDPTSNPRYLALWWAHQGSSGGGADGTNYEAIMRYLGVFGDHGLTKRGAAPDQGFFASDAVAHAVGRWASELTFTEGTDGTISPSSFVIPHLAFLERTTAGEIVRQATRFGLQDWAVWNDKEFWWHERGARGKNWRTRVGPAQLEETGPQLDRLWNSVIVSYSDVDGTTKTVGPIGSGADTQTADLTDTDPLNPANILGLRRRDLLSMGVSTAAGATEVGRRFLEEQALLDRSGRAQLVGHVEDDRGVLHPASRVRAGDMVTFVDANDTSARRVVRADYSHDSRTCTVDLDAPPEALEALLSRLAVSLVPLGL